MNRSRSRSQMEWTPQLERQLRAALKEDVGEGDVTSQAMVAAKLRGRGELIAKAPGMLCGAQVAQKIFNFADKSIKIEWLAHDGDPLERGQKVARLAGRMRGLLAGERVALNFLQRLSGVATLTARYHDAAGGADGPVISDTRKTTPLWRTLERYAVRIGGGTNHRFGLFDMIMIKENHARAAGGLRQAIELARRNNPKKLRIAAEAHSPAEVAICCEEKVDLVMLDNFTPVRARRVIEEFRSAGIPFELTGGITLRNIGAFARIGADRISIGALTHSAPALDLSLQLYLED